MPLAHRFRLLLVAVFIGLGSVLSATAQTAQTITFPIPFDRPANSTSFQLQATASSGLPVTYVLVSGPATVSGDRLTFTGITGAITVRATQPGDATRAPASPVEVTFQATTPTIGTIPQFIAFSLPADAAVGMAPITLNGTASSSLPLTYTLTEGAEIASLDGNVLTLTGTGTIRVRASQAGDPSYAPSTREATTTVAKGRQTITFTLSSTKIALGATVPALNATASSGLPVEYTVVSGPATLRGLKGGAALLPSAPGTIKIRADQFGDDNYLPAPAVERTLTVSGPALALANLRQPYDATPRPVTVTGVPAGYEDSLVVTYSARAYPASTTPPTDAGTYTVTATLGTVKKSGSLLITKAPLLVRAEDATRSVDVANPSFTLTYEGFLGDDTEAALDRRPLPVTKAKVNSPAGSYPITFTGGLDNNYTFSPAPEPGQLTVIGFGGTYEALLVDAAIPYGFTHLVPIGKLTLTISTNALTYTGTLTLASETAPAPIKGSITPAEDLGSATLAFTRPSTTALPSLDLAVTIAIDRAIGGSLVRGEDRFLYIERGSPLYVPAPHSTAPWIGAHTLVLNPPVNLLAEGSHPADSGHATADINASGTLKLTGKLADGTPLTASLSPNASGYYRLYVNPYGKRLDSFLSGYLRLSLHPDSDRYPTPRYYIPDSALICSIYWQKAALPETTPEAKQDKSYRDGFGPLVMLMNLDPWIPPSSASSLPQLLGLTESNTASATLDLALLPELLDLGTSGSTLPASLTVTSAAKLTVPLPNPRAFKFTSFNAKTGAFTGTFTLSDPSTTSPRPVLRTVTFSGTLRQPPSTESDPVLGAGHFLVPDLLSKTAAQPSAGLLLSGAPAE